MSLPENSIYFVESVINESRQLIDRGLWDIRMARFDSWIKQFCGPEEEYFCACLLDQLTFRTTQQFEASLRSLFRSNLNGKIFTEFSDLELLGKLEERKDQRLRVVPVICESDPPTKSGPLVLRRLQRILQIRQKWMCWPWQAAEMIHKNEVDIIIFVDDFLGSGVQFERFFKQWKFHETSEEVSYFYAPVVAHQQGIKHISTKLPFVRVTSAETLNKSHGFFDDAVWNQLGQGCVSANDAKIWYGTFTEHHGIRPRDMELGVGDLALTFGFSHSTPNNSLPILWYENEQTGWQPILER
ncbi:hypothetical protein A1353_00205 [Methylomonas methanica]|uniref:PRTase-CE domain-containing protein n=1 Tax=Methylomonas methanica TaxID=421 RepID=A0A177MIW1_METMH|nr:hypothetical protein [Methylomonas methanica]OAI05295.1 hypothetical protein A1353_00205 [Methylomonas methanica]